MRLIDSRTTADVHEDSRRLHFRETGLMVEESVSVLGMWENTDEKVCQWDNLRQTVKTYNFVSTGEPLRVGNCELVDSDHPGSETVLCYLAAC